VIYLAFDRLAQRRHGRAPNKPERIGA